MTKRCPASGCSVSSVAYGTGSPGSFQNSIFTVISSQKGPTLKAQTSLKQSCPRQRLCCMSSSGSASHILHVRNGMDHNTSPQEQQRFKASVSDQVIHSLSIMAKGQSNNHVSQLTTCTVCNNAFYIILHQSHGSSHLRSDGTNIQQKCSSNSTTFPNPGRSCNQKHSRSHKCCCMNQCRDGCRTFHPVCQPYVQTNLRTFPLSTSGLCKANNISIRRSTGSHKKNRSVCASLIPPANKQSKKQDCIAHTIHQHCFLSRFCPAQTMKPKANQQVATNPNHFPTNQECNEVIGSHQQQHRSGEEALIALKASTVGVSLHIPQTVEVHTKAHGRDCEHHGRTQRVKTLKPVYSQSMGAKPRAQREHDCRRTHPDFIKHQKT